MKLVVLQPSYLPWLGYFDQYAWSDVFVIYDDVQYDKNGWRNRNRILGPQGPLWLTVPVLRSGRDWPLVREIEIDNRNNWRRKHLLSIQQNYSRTPWFATYFPALETWLSKEWNSLLDLNVEGLRILTQALGLPWRVHLASDLNVPGRKTERLVGICRKLGATDYLTGDAAREYLDETQFQEIQVKVHWHGYSHPEYRQRGKEFVPYLSVVDLLFNHGPDSLDILTGRTVTDRSLRAQ